MSWVAVAPSAWQRRLRRFASALTAATVAAMAAVVFLPPSWVTACAALVAGILGATLHLGARHYPERAWSVSADGRIAVRNGEMVDRGAAIVFAAPFLVVLRARGQTFEIWRDAVPIRAFRRLSVAARWGALRGGSVALTAIKPGHANDRT